MCFRPATIDKKCPQCGESVGQTDTICPKCGASLPAFVAPGAPSAPGAPKAPGVPKAPGAK